MRKWCVIFIISGYFFIPDQVLALEEDRYRLNTIGLRVDLTYNSEKIQNSASNTTSSSESFEQRYSLEANGLVVSPKLMTYTAGIEFLDKDASDSSGGYNMQLQNYVFGSTILRKSRIPLVLSATRNISNTSYADETLNDKYGIDWHLKFRTLPWTRLTFDKTQTRSSGIHTDTDTSKIELSKSVGPSSNKLYYYLSNSSDPLQNYDSHGRIFGLANDTNLPMQTDLNVRMQRSNNYDASSDSSATGGTVGLKSEPISGLIQRLDYAITESASNSSGGNDSDSVNESFRGGLEYNAIKNMTASMYYQKSLSGNSQESTDSSAYSTSSGSDKMSGNLMYWPTKNINMFMSASSNSEETLSSTVDDIKSNSSDYSAGASNSHALTRNLSAKESVNYSRTDESNGDRFTGLTNRSIYNANAELNYNKDLKWSSLAMGALMGINHETTEPGGDGTGVAYGCNAGLSGIKRRHFTLGTQYSCSGTYSTAGDINSKDQTFSINALGNHGARLPISITYDYHHLDSYVQGEDVAEQKVSGNTSIYYIQKLPITLGYNYSTSLRPDSIPPELHYLYIKKQFVHSFEATTKILHINWLPLNVSYKYSIMEQPYEIPALELSEDQQYYHKEKQEEKKIGLNTDLTYFRSISISGSMSYSVINDVNYVTSTGLTEEYGYRKKNMKLSGSHNRTFLRGRLGLSTGYDVTITDNITQDIREYYSIVNINGTYDKRMSRNMMLKLAAKQSFADINGVLDSQLTGNVNVYYKLRAWFLSAEYQHAVSKEDSTEVTSVIEDRFMLKVSRSFIRVI